MYKNVNSRKHLVIICDQEKWEKDFGKLKNKNGKTAKAYQIIEVGVLSQDTFELKGDTSGHIQNFCVIQNSN